MTGQALAAIHPTTPTTCSADPGHFTTSRTRGGDSEPGSSPGIHRREHTSVLAASEKHLLVWIAERLPSAINADHLTALGAIASVGVGLSFAAVPFSRWALLAVPVFLALNWFGDSLDGTVARVRRQQRPRYGF